MSNTKTLNNSSTPSNSNLYKLQDNASGFIANSFPIRRLVRTSFDRKFWLFFFFCCCCWSYFKFLFEITDEQAWIAAYRAENKKYFEAVLTNQKLDELERDELSKEQKVVPKRRILKKLNFLEEDASRNPHTLDGFYLVLLHFSDLT